MQRAFVFESNPRARGSHVPLAYIPLVEEYTEGIRNYPTP